MLVDRGGVMNDSHVDQSLLEAVSFAARAHRDQKRKDDQTPYAAHPFRVCLVVRQVFGFDDRAMLTTALLHDTVEDTTTDFDALAEKFSPEVARWVGLLSKDKRLPEADRERAYVEQLGGAPWQVQVCKLADVYDNLLDSGTLPAERREQSLKRAESYVEALGTTGAAETTRPLQQVRQLLQQLRGQRPGPPDGSIDKARWEC